MFCFEKCVKYANANEITNYVIHSTYCYIKFINNGNWTSGRAIWSEIIRVMHAARSFDLKSQVWFQIKIARPEVQLPLYYIHFKIAQFNSLKIQELQEQQWLFCLSFSTMWLVSLKIGCFALLSHSHWLRKRCVEQKLVRFGNKSHCWEPIRLQG